MDSDGASQLYRFTFVLAATLAAVAAFLFLIQYFIIDILLAAIFAGMLYPVFERALPLCGGRRGVCAAAIVVAGLLVIALPVAAIVAIVASEAIQVSGAAIAWIATTASHPELLVPHAIAATPTGHQAVEWLSSHAAAIVNALASFLSQSLSNVLLGTGRAILDLFVIAIAMLYFLEQGPALVAHIIERMPIARDEARAVVDRTLRITSGTLRYLIVDGLADGVLVGIGFAFSGIGEPWFWGAVAAVLSQTPGLGSGIVWIPGALFLLLTGHLVPGIALAVWGGIVITLVDSVLLVRIVGSRGAIPKFLVLVSTLGGLSVLGPSGLLIGPVLTGIVMGMLDLYYGVVKSSRLLKDS